MEKQKAFLKADFAQEIAEQNNSNKTEILKYLNSFLSLIKAKLNAGHEVKLVKYLTFKIKDRKPRNSRNPRTGEAIKVPAKKVVSVSMNPSFKKLDQQLN